MKKATPIWLKDMSEEVNIQAGFVAEFNGGKPAVLYITGSTLYRIFINGKFVHYGPARAPHGYARVDELDISDSVVDGKNTIAIEVAGYHCFTYYTIKQKNFLMAEILRDDQVLCATGNNFKGFRLYEREQKVMRYSFQRNFTEVWNYGKTPWTSREDFADLEKVDLKLQLIPRAVPIPNFETRRVQNVLETGAYEIEEREVTKDRYITNISEQFTGFPEDQLVSFPFYTVQKMKYTQQENKDAFHLMKGKYSIFDLGRNTSGFIQSKLAVNSTAKVLLYFDELLHDGKVIFKKFDTANVIEYNLEAGAEYDLISFECYGFRYLAIAVLEGDVSIQSVGVLEYKYPLGEQQDIFIEDKELERIYHAAVETFRQNTVDVFMDCPTRERAGWLCDSYFTAQAEYCFTGKSVVEKAYMENFVLAEHFPFLPEGMLPMCYPADHPDGIFIPQWAMWYVVELDQYLMRDAGADAEFFRETCYRLVHYFEQFVNGDGLLERLPSWNFIEWSKANEWSFDVNYPTNMLYSKMLEIIGRRYQDEKILEQSRRLKKKIVTLSFDGKMFVDNAVRDPKGILRNTNNHSEACQYYAYFFEIIDRGDSRYRDLIKLIYDVFGPQREKNKIMPEVEYANALMGVYMRLELLLKWGEKEKLLSEIKQYFGGMAEITGTLWEHNKPCASLNHGFASFAGVVIQNLLKNGFLE